MPEETVIPADVNQLRELVADLRRQLEHLTRQAEEERRRRKRTERKLRDSEAVYTSLVQSLPVSLIRKDLEGRLTFANRPVCEEYGRELQDLIGKTDYDFFPKELAEKYRADDRRVIETRQVFEDVESHRTPEGEWRYAHVIKAPVVDSEGEAVAVQAVFWDVTDRKRAEEELKSSEARKRAIFETSLDCLIISDETGKIVEFNRAAEQTFGYTRDEALGQDMDDLLFAPSIRARPRQNIDRFSAFSEEGSLLGKRLEVPLVRRGGEEFIAEMAMQPIPLEGTVHFATVLHDITNRKRAEAELQQAKEAAEAASQAKSAFLANMSHEIRTPMNAILGMTGLVLDTELTPEQRDHLLIVQDSAESLLSLINDILDFSKIEAGRLDLLEQPFRLRDRLGDTMKSLSIRAHDKGLELACHVAPDVPDHLRGDAGRLRQIVVNLVGNAIKFTDAGEVLLDVEVDRRADPVCQLHVRVTDTGIGIPSEQHTRVFEAFEQIDSSTTRRHGGTGLGLAISRRLVELMGGHIWVESQPGRGSTFHFTVPLEVVAGAPAAEPATDALRGLPVLIVDDNATNRHILEEVLLNWGMTPLAVDGAGEALAVLHRRREDGAAVQLVLSDVNMPGTDGFELARQIRSDPHFAGLPVMLLTSGDHPDDGERCRRLGVDRYMTKPVKQSELLDAIRAVFEGPRLASGPARGEPAREHVRGRHILLVEDSLPNQKLTTGLLHKHDHQVTVAGDGVEALRAWKSAPFDLILMDLQMPHMDGLEATRLIRKREQTTGRHVPIVAMTAHAMKGDEERCLEAGMDAYVAKPIRPEDLFDAMDRLLPTAAATAADAADALPDASSTPAPDATSIDWKAALEVVQHDEELLRDVIDAVLEEVPRLMQELDAAISAQDTPTIRRLAHTIKGNLRTFHAQPSTDTAERVERQGRDDSLHDTRETYRQLEPQIEAFLRSLRESPYAPARGESED